MKTCLFPRPVFVCLLVIISVVSRLHADDEKAAELTNPKEQAAELDEDRLSLDKSTGEVKPSKDSISAEVNDSAPKAAVNSRIGGQFGIGPDPKRIQGMGVYVVETEDGMAAYSEKLGKWDRVKAGPRSDGKPILSGCTVGMGVIAAIVNDELFGFCGDAGKWNRQSIGGANRGNTSYVVGRDVLAAVNQVEVFGMNAKSKRWSVLTIPEEHRGKTYPKVGNHFAEVLIGNKTYVLSSSTGEWTSPDDTEQLQSNAANDFVKSPATPTRRSSLSIVESDLSNRIAQHEANAAVAASKLRNLPKEIGKGHPSAIEARLELDQELAAALDLRFDREELQMKELRSRLGRLEQQISQRKQQRTAILEHRANELLEGEVLNWNTSTDGQSSNTDEAVQPDKPVDPESEVSNPSGKLSMGIHMGNRRRGIRSRRGEGTSSQLSGMKTDISDELIEALLSKLKAAQLDVSEATLGLRRSEHLNEASKSPKTVKGLHDAQKKVTSAIVVERSILGEIETALSELESQKDAAQFQMHKAAADKTAAPDETQRALQAIQKLEERTQLLRQKIDGLTQQSTPRVLDAIVDLPNLLEDPKFRGSYLSNIFGLEFGDPVSRETNQSLRKTRFSKGLPISRVKSQGPAANLGIKNGDILVGIDKWETESTKNVLWILDQLKPNSNTDEAYDIKIKVLIVRDGEERTGEITLNLAKQTSPRPIQDDQVLSPGF